MIKVEKIKVNNTSQKIVYKINTLMMIWDNSFIKLCT